MGNTGCSYGAHLHFEVWKDNTRINPKPYINADLPNLTTQTKPLTSKIYTTGTYKVTAELLNVRAGAGTGYAKKTYTQLTANAQAQNKKLGSSRANGLVKNCIVTVSQVKNNWGKIPSGWICLDYCVKI